MLRAFAAVASLFVLVTPPPARAETAVPGGLLATQTWAVAGSPYVVAGDVTVPAGAMLTIQPGVTVQFAATDAQAGGLSATKAELNILGALVAEGAPGAPITFTGTVPSAGSWYGVVVGSSATGCSLHDVRIEHAERGLSLAATGANTYSAITVEGASGAGVYVSAGSPSLTGCVLRVNGAAGLQDVASAGTVTLDHCTITGNGGSGVALTSMPRSGAIAVRDSIIVANGSYGFYPTMGEVSIEHADVWGNATGDDGGYACSMISDTCLYANPLFVSSSNVRITANSPARFAASDGADLGALPFAGDPTSPLQGMLWSDMTLAADASPIALAGDLTVPAGVTLTIEPGVTLSVASSDGMVSGTDAARVELRISGALLADGTPSAPIALTGATPEPGSWFGIVFLAGATGSSLNNLTLSYPARGLSIPATGSNAYSSITVRDASEAGAMIWGGSPVLDRFTSTGSSLGIWIRDFSAPTLVNCVLSHNAEGAYAFGASIALTLEHCTIAGNTNHGVYAYGSPGPSSLSIANSIVVANGGIGVSVSGMSASITHSDVWDNAGGNLAGAALGTGSFSADPRFLSSSNLRLKAGSPCIDVGSGGASVDADGFARPVDGDRSGTAVTDVGAYEFTPPVVCGDGFVEGDEACDDGNAVDTDACLATCAPASCGDAFVQDGVEECDDGGVAAGDGCAADCMVEPAGEPSAGCSCGSDGPGGLASLLGLLALLPLPRRARVA